MDVSYELESGRPISRSARRDFFIGVLGAAGAMTWLLLGRLYAGIVTPHERLADWIVQNVPMSWFEAGINTLGGSAKPLLSVAILIATLLAGGLLGVLYSRLRARRMEIGVAAVLLLFAPCIAFLLIEFWRSGFSITAVSGAPSFFAFGYLIFALVVVASSEAQGAARAAGAQDLSRRRLLRRALYGGGALLGVAGVVAVLPRLIGRATVSSLTRDASGMPAAFTPTDDFYVISKNLLDPSVKTSSWRLRIGGLVDRPYELVLDDLRALPAVEQDQTLECISNPIGGDLIGNAHWKGVRLGDLLGRAGVQTPTVDIKMSCADGYTESIPLGKAMETDVVLAYEMNGEPLTDEHGAPARLLVPNIFGMKNVKWVHSIEAVNTDFKGFWQEQGWSDVATVQTMAQIRLPARGAQVTTGQPITVGGLAFAGSRGISKVEWSADDGKTWREARLRSEIAPLSWRLWDATWRPDTAGVARLAVRATDGDGNLQTHERRDTLPDGATGYHKITVDVS